MNQANSGARESRDDRATAPEALLETVLAMTGEVIQELRDGNLMSSATMLKQRGALLAKAAALLQDHPLAPGNGTLRDIAEENARLMELLLTRQAFISQKIRETQSGRKIAMYQH